MTPQQDQPEGRALKDAADRRLMPEVEADNAAQRKTVAILKRALKAAETHNEKAVDLALKAVAADPSSGLAHHVAGVTLDRAGRLSQALQHYENAWRLTPENADIYQNLGLVAWKLDMVDAAEKFFRLYRKMRPNSTDGAINLAGALRDKGQFDDAAQILQTSVYANMAEPTLWNALGTVLLESGDPGQAVTFYNEAIRLDPDFARGWHNLAYALDLIGDLPGAISAFENALESPASPGDAAEMRHGLAHTLLADGQVARGWDEYAVRLTRDYNKSTVFLIKAPRWEGDTGALKGKRVLLVGEQGLGDEILFMNAARDLQDAIGPDGELMIACTRRLVPLFQRSFPNAHVGQHGTFEAEGKKFRAVTWLEEHGGCDVWLPMGELARAFRGETAAFPDRSGYMTPDPERVAAIKAQLDAIGPDPKIGIVWKSMLMTTQRSKFFSPFEQWRSVLETPGVSFVSLQYGDTADELARAEADYGVKIHQLDDLDLKDDLDGVAALGAALDLSIGPMNASTNLAASTGADVWFIAYKSHWPLLGAGRLLWYPQTRAFSPENWGDWKSTMGDIASALKQRLSKEKAA